MALLGEVKTSLRYDKVFDRVLKLQTFISEDVHRELASHLPNINNQYLAANSNFSSNTSPANRFQQHTTNETENDLPGRDYGHTRHMEWLVR